MSTRTLPQRFHPKKRSSVGYIMGVPETRVYCPARQSSAGTTDEDIADMTRIIQWRKFR